MDQLLQQRILDLGFSAGAANLLSTGIILAGILLVALLATLLVKQVVLRILSAWIHRNRYQWDDALIKNKVFSKLTWFVPVLIFSLSIDSFLPKDTTAAILCKRIILCLFVLVSVLSFNSLLSAINDIFRYLRKRRGATIQSYVDAAKIIAWVIAAIFIASIFTGKSPWGILSILGGLTAVTMLVFKDTILGFVASIQLSASNMVQVGDWIEMPQYGADGDVIQISINTVRVQNWDKTVTTIPTYALVSSSFKNWRGMSESGGRRIKRCLLIDTGSIRFCDAEMLERFKQFDLLRDYLQKKDEEIEAYNRNQQVDTATAVNGRRQTNIGVFRAYVKAYLAQHPNIHPDMTFLVRQLPPKEHGLPLEIYVFSNDQVWANYEAIQADIFDHLLAAAPEFDLHIFQNPSSRDIRMLAAGLTGQNQQNPHD